MKDLFVEVCVKEKLLAPFHAIPAAEAKICLCAKAGDELDRHSAVREGDDVANA
jgi:hypothetical protein